MTRTQKQILRAIVGAQKASDMAKGYEWSKEESPVRSQWYSNYNAKLFSIIRALKMLDKEKPFGVTYYVIKDYDQNGYASVIVYFNIRRPEGKFQISFHTPWTIADELIPWIGKGCPCRWNKRLGGSNVDSKKLIEIFDL